MGTAHGLTEQLYNVHYVLVFNTIITMVFSLKLWVWCGGDRLQ